MEELYIDRAKFDAVWNRVMSDGTPQRVLDTRGIMPAAAGKPECPGCDKKGGADNDSAMLMKFMDMAAINARYCRETAQKCPGRVARTLSYIAENERRHLKKLRAEYFVLTGCNYCPEDVRPAVCTVSGALRNICMNLSRCSEEFLAASEKAAPAIACTYRRFAVDEERDAESVVCLIESMIC